MFANTNLDADVHGSSPIIGRRDVSSGYVGGGNSYSRESRAESPVPRSLSRDVHMPDSPERNGDGCEGRRVEITPLKVSIDLENFQSAPPTNQDKTMPRFVPAYPNASLSEHGHKLMDHMDACGVHLGISRFLKYSEPKLESLAVYEEKFLELSPHVREAYARSTAIFELKTTALVNLKARATEAYREAVLVRDEQSRVPDVGETAPQRLARISLLNSAVESVQRAESKLDSIERDGFDNAEKKDSNLAAYQEATAKLNVQCFQQRQNDIVYLGRLKGAIDTMFIEIYRILVLPGYAPLKSAFEKARCDPENPHAPAKDQLKARNLQIIYGVLARRLKNVEDKFSNLAELCHVVDTTRKFPSKAESMNFYFDMNGRMQAKGITVVTTVDLMALLCLLSWSREDRDKFMDHQQMSERIRYAKGGSVVGEKDPSFMDLIVEYLDLTEQNDLQRYVLSGDKGVSGTAHKGEKGPSLRDIERKVDFDLKQNHSRVLAAETDDSEYTLEERINNQVREQLRKINLNSNSNTGMVQRVAAAVGTEQYCFDFQRGACKRGADCKFLHKKDPTQTPVGTRKPAGGHGAPGSGAATARAVPNRGSPNPVTPKPKSGGAGMVKVPAHLAWDVTGQKLCFKGPYFTDHPDGPCPHPYACPYSHLAPHTTVKPANARMALIAHKSERSSRGLGPGEEFIDFLLGELPWQVPQASSILDELTSHGTLRAYMARTGRGKKRSDELTLDEQESVSQDASDDESKRDTEDDDRSVISDSHPRMRRRVRRRSDSSAESEVGHGVNSPTSAIVNNPSSMIVDNTSILGWDLSHTQAFEQQQLGFIPHPSI